METLLTAIAGFITDHWFLTFLILFFNPIRLFTINISKVKKEEKKESKKEKKDESRDFTDGDK